MSTSCADDLRGLLRSGWRLVAFETFEEERALQVLERVAKSGSWKLVPWSVARGLGDSGQGVEGADGGTLGVATTIIDAHAEWRARGLRARALWSRAEVDDVAELNPVLGLAGAASVGEELEGWYLEAGYDTLASRGGRASLTPFVRWEEIDTQVAVPSGWGRNPGNDQRVLTLGLAYQPLPQVVVKIDWQQVETGASSGVDQLNVGLGYIF